MSDAAAMLKELANPWKPGEFVKDVITRVAPLAGLSFWRASDIWYAKARKIDPAEIEKIQEALRIKNRRSVRNELHELKTRIAQLEARLSLRDADFHSPDIDYARDMASGPRGMAGQR
jgi:hypothetical protein